MATAPLSPLRIIPDSVTVSRHGPARLELELRRSQYPADGSDVFQPLRLPDRCAVTLGGPVLQGLSRLKSELEVKLRPGLHTVPLGSGPPCQIRVLEDALASVRLEVGPSPGGSGPAVLALEVELQPALVIHNLAQTLTQLHDVVDDRYFSLLRPIRRRVPDWLRQLGGLALDSVDATALILLERVSARPRWGAEPRLRLGFSGRVQLMEHLERRFDDVVLPSPILPVPHALLERLLSAHPLITAELVRPEREALGVAEAVCAAVGELRGKLTVEGRPPVVRVRGSTSDATHLELSLRHASSIKLTGQFHGRLSGTRLDLAAEELHLSTGEADAGLALSVEGGLAAELGSAPMRLRDRFSGGLGLRVQDGAKWPSLSVELRTKDTVAIGEAVLPLELEGIEPSGGLRLSLRPGELAVRPAGSLGLRSSLRSATPLRLSRTRSQWTGEVQANVALSVRSGEDGGWLAELHGAGRLNEVLEQRISSFPELGIASGLLRSAFDATAELSLSAALRAAGGQRLQADLAGSRFAATLERGRLELGERHLSVPQGTRLSGRVLEGTLSPAGLEGLALDLRWDLLGQQCLLHHRDQAVSLLAEDLRQGQLVLLLDPSGRIRFTGSRGGLYGVRYFNALLNPAGDPQQLLDLFRSEEALSHVVGALSVFAPGLAEALADLRALWLAARDIASREGLRQLADVIPRCRMARLFSVLLVGDDSLQQRLADLIQGVTEGRGLDLGAAKEILLQQLGELDIDYEVTALLNWLNVILSPSEPLESAPAEPELPLALDPAHAGSLVDLPSAEEIYQTVRRGELDAAWACRLAELAPQLTRKQLSHILSRAAPSWHPRVLARLRYAEEIKKRVEAIAEGYGGVEYLLQSATIATFLGEAVGPLPGINHPEVFDELAWPPPCALGPADVAVLLQAGLASGVQSRRTQINNRLLLELMRRQPPPFTREVLVELGHQSPHALSGILYAFLDQEQDHLAHPIDLVDFLGERLGIPVPRQRDFMAGGHKARQSYYEALSRVADQILEEANPYLARRAHLQIMRRPVSPELLLTPPLERLEERAQAAVARADELGAGCSFSGGRGGPQQRARRVYQAAFQSCAQLMRREPRAFQRPWLRAFWLRNEEALRVLSMVRGHQEDRDRDRHWLAVQCGRDHFGGEQELLEALVRAIYWGEEAQAAVLADPLVRLLIDPSEGKYDFTIVSCMGVITDGKDGAELEDAYRRLEERRGVRILRAHTGVACSLEHNASKIISAIEACRTPYGVIGYSQGCANALLAESNLYGGTPEEQALLEGLVCRNFLFSAANGSAHGTSWMIKFQRALVLGERYLKHYQAIYSWEAIKAALHLIRAALDSRTVVNLLGGTQSLSFERARLLHREGQFLESAPTSITRGVVSEDRLPETLEYLYHVLRELTWAAPQDTQVLISDAVGSSTRVLNESTRTLARCDMATLPQATHHWAPLTREVEFVTTERDRARAIYESPKDRLVWPWVEVNARFGRIACI